MSPPVSVQIESSILVLKILILFQKREPLVPWWFSTSIVNQNGLGSFKGTMPATSLRSDSTVLGEAIVVFVFALKLIK